jgi:hypothetical protein
VVRGPAYVEVLTDRCRRMYEEANELVERLRRLQSGLLAVPTDQWPLNSGRSAGLPPESRRRGRRRGGRDNGV